VEQDLEGDEMPLPLRHDGDMLLRLDGAGDDMPDDDCRPQQDDMGDGHGDGDDDSLGCGIWKSMQARLSRVELAIDWDRSLE